MDSQWLGNRARAGRRMKYLAFALSLLLAGCASISMTCPDKVSTVTYKGLSLTGTTSVSCTATPSGYVAQVSGIDLMALATMVAPIVAAGGLHENTGQGN
jgi:hypothetical protein